MSKVTFVFDKGKDIENIWKTINDNTLKDFSQNIPQKIKGAVQGKTLEQAGQELENINNNFYNSQILQIFTKTLNNSWKTIEKEYQERIEKITKKPFVKGKINAYLTTISKCPYSPEEKWFMVSVFNNIFGCMQTAGHELFHLQFHKYFFKKVEKQIGAQKTHELKESLTILLNLEFKDLWFVEDKGYEQHKDLRNFIKEQWQSQKEKDFDVLIEKCVEYLKEK